MSKFAALMKQARDLGVVRLEFSTELALSVDKAVKLPSGLVAGDDKAWCAYAHTSSGGLFFATGASGEGALENLIHMIRGDE